MAPRKKRRGRPLPKVNAPAPTPRRLIIDRLGAGGDGMSDDIAVPYALPGEEVVADVAGKEGRLTVIASPSPARHAAQCAHFGLPGDECGGCHLQHMGTEESLAWKVARVEKTLGAALADPLPTTNSFQTRPSTRRRAKFAITARKNGVAFGFHARRSHRVVQLKDCAILEPALFAVRETLAKAKLSLPIDRRRGGALLLTLTETGIDAAMDGMDEAALSPETRQRLCDVAQEAGIIHLSVDGIPVLAVDKPTLSFDDVPVHLPSGAFLQATQDGEQALQRAVCGSVGEAGKVADLFCGVGTFSLPLSRKATVTAVDIAGPAIDALTQAAKRAGRHVTPLRRNLFTDPLTTRELEAFDAVVFDPPRAGARVQAETLATSGVPTVIAVSCNPATLARDAATLAPHYRLDEVYVVDQFLWSPHIEVVSVFRRR